MYHHSDPMKAYMQEISQVPLITRDEEVELAAQIRGGSEAAKHKLVKANLRLVVKIAHDFKGLGLPLLDLISGPFTSGIKILGNFIIPPEFGGDRQIIFMPAAESQTV